MTIKQREIIIKSLLWFITLFIIIFIGVNKIFADTYDATQYNAQLYDNYGPSLHSVSTNFTNMSWRGEIPTMVANSSGAAWGISSPIVLLANHTYSMSIRIDGTYGGLLVLSTYNRIGVGTTLSNAVSSYENNINVNENYSKVMSGQPIIQFAFTPTINANYIVFPFATNYSGSNQAFYLYNVIIDDLGSSGGVSESTINNSLNNQTNIINNSISSSTNTITQNDNNNRDLIIDSQEQTRDAIIQNDTENTDRLIEDNKKNFNDCRDSYNLINKNELTIGYIDSTGTMHTGGGSSYTTNILNIGKGTFTISNGHLEKICFYNDNDTFNACSAPSYSSSSLEYTFTLTSFNKVRLQFRNSDLGNLMLNKGSTALDYEPYGEEICVNKLDEQNKTSKGILGKLGELITNLFSNDGPDTEQFEDMAGWLPPGPIDSILTLPLTLLNSMNNALGGTCVTFTAPIPFVNDNFTFPCFSSLISQINGGNTLWSWVGAIASVLILYKYLIALYEWVDNVLMLRYNLHEDLGGNSANFGGV